MLMTSRWATRTRKAYLAWLDLASHEFFHAWNVKRLRPLELGPFDYEHENYTRSLWVVEGLTDYYGELALHRAGLSTADECLDGLSNQIEAVQTTPGRLVQSAGTASFEAWIRFYRPDENSPNVSISYYTKGAVLAFLLDAKLRQATGGARSLDDVMRAAYRQYAGDHGYTPDQFRAVAEQAAGTSLQAFWDSAVEGVGELDYAEALGAFGLRFARAVPPNADPAGADPTKADVPPKAFLGLVTHTDNGRLLVTQVHRGTPAHDAGLNVDDEIVAIDDFRVPADQLTVRLEQYRPGDVVGVLVAKREQLQRIRVTLGVEPVKQWRLEVDPGAGEAQKKLRAAWLQPC